jgi:2-iminobutanoate/2-iminopropanoate deaminase
MPIIERYDPFDGSLGFPLASRIGDVIHVSGLTALLPDLSVPDGLAAQAGVVYGHIAAVLRHFGATLDDVVSQLIHVTVDPVEAFTVLGPIRKACFGSNTPSSTLVGVSGLVDPRYLIEITVVAAAPVPAEAVS